MPKRVTVTQKSDSGRNERFRDNFTGSNMTRRQFVREIERGNYHNHHIREINEAKTPVSNPDNSESNNLGKRADASLPTRGQLLFNCLYFERFRPTAVAPLYWFISRFADRPKRFSC